MTSIRTEADVRITSLRRRVLLVGGAIPVAIAGVASAVMASWIPELPDQIAVHWNSSGADGFGSPWPMVFMPFGLVVAFSVFAVIAAWKPTVNGRLTSSQKIMVATSVWLSAMLSVGIGGSVAIQRGLEDASEVGDINLLILAGVASGLVLAVGAWFALPPADRNPHEGSAPEPLVLQPSERVTWSRSVRLAPAAFGVALAALGAGVLAVVLPAPASR